MMKTMVEPMRLIVSAVGALAAVWNATELYGHSARHNAKMDAVVTELHGPGGKLGRVLAKMEVLPDGVVEAVQKSEMKGSVGTELQNISKNLGSIFFQVQGLALREFEKEETIAASEVALHKSKKEETIAASEVPPED